MARHVVITEPGVYDFHDERVCLHIQTPGVTIRNAVWVPHSDTATTPDAVL